MPTRAVRMTERARSWTSSGRRGSWTSARSERSASGSGFSAAATTSCCTGSSTVRTRSSTTRCSLRRLRRIREIRQPPPHRRSPGSVSRLGRHGSRRSALREASPTGRMRAVNLGTAPDRRHRCDSSSPARSCSRNGFPRAARSVAGPSGGASPSGSASSPTASPPRSRRRPVPPRRRPGVVHGAQRNDGDGRRRRRAAGARRSTATTSVAGRRDARAPGRRQDDDATTGLAKAAPRTSRTPPYVADDRTSTVRRSRRLDPSLESVVPPSATIAVVVGQDFAQTLVQ